MKLSWFIYIFLAFQTIKPCAVFGQFDKKFHKRSVVNKKEKWKPGKLNDTRHVVDSFFYENGAIKEVAESIIKREKFRVVDSISVNQRKQWSKNGELMLVEYFDTKTGTIKRIESNYPPNKNLIQNGSFEQHTDIHCHKTTKGPIDQPATHRNTIISIIKKDTIHVINDQKGTTKYILNTEETKSNDETGFYRKVESYVLIETNGRITDSIYVRPLHLSLHDLWSLPTSAKHECNYNTTTIQVNGWNSVGRAYPNIFDFEKRGPWHPLTGLADSVFHFSPAEGNHFVKLAASAYSGVICNPLMDHPLLQTSLNATLDKGKKYQLEFWLWKPKAYQIKQSLQVCFTQEPVTINNYREFALKTFTLPAFNDSIIQQWQKVTLTFETLEFARYMTIGFFDEVLGYFKPEIDKGPYLSEQCFVDGFILTEVEFIKKALPLFYIAEVDQLTSAKKQGKSQTIVFNDQKIEQNKPVVLENINFNVDSHVLLPESINGLQDLILILETYPNIRIEIIGHTDNSVTEAYNQELSEKRAETVVQHLIEKGIAAHRLSWKGFGNKFPVASNEAVDGQEKNRRVEFIYVNENQ
jgi:outer membrane protein OmpA-like peptidoglycan-associated protein